MPSNKTFSIRKMKEDEVQLAINWAAKEGWNPGLVDAECFYKADPNGFFVGLLDNEPIAVGSAVAYDDHFAFCGLYIVKPEFRGQGYGIQLTQERLKYVGNRITGLDGVLDKVSKYERLGYISSYKNTRYVFQNSLALKTASPNIVDLRKYSIKNLETFDRQFFPAPRTAFLISWINQPQSHALGYVQDQKLMGYGVIRKCLDGHKIGPLFAQSPEIANALFISLCSKIQAGPVFLDIPELNNEGLALAKHYKMTPKFEVIRMYRNGFPEVNISGVFGITTFELG